MFELSSSFQSPVKREGYIRFKCNFNLRNFLESGLEQRFFRSKFSGLSNQKIH